jgi:DNA-binding CsgD family transcriptional regulator
VTARQHQVLDLIAQGRTNKEMSHMLGISERGVAAQVSRLLVKFGVANRASLVAAVLSELTADEEPPRPLRYWTDLSSVVTILGTELSALRTAPFIVLLTLGRNQLIGFMSELAERATGVNVATVFGTPLRDHVEGAAVQKWADVLGESFRTGAAASLEGFSLRWRRDDGNTDSQVFSCIAQPLRGVDGAVRGFLFVCSTATEQEAVLPDDLP